MTPVIDLHTLPRQLRTVRNVAQAYLLQPKTVPALFKGIMVLATLLLAYQAANFFWLITLGGDAQLETTPIPAQLSDQKAHTSLNAADFEALAQATWFGTNNKLAAQSLEEQAITQETGLNMTLKGTILGDMPRAIITNQADGKTQVLAPNEEVIAGVTVAQIDRRQVVLNNNGTMEKLSLPGFDLAEMLANGMDSASVEALQEMKGNGGGYMRLVDRPIEQRQKISISQAEVTQALSNIGSLATQARLIKVRAGNMVEGYKIKQLKNNSFLSALSLQENDTLLSLNGVHVSDREKILPLMMDLQKATQAEILLRRGGENIALTVAVKP